MASKVNMIYLLGLGYILLKQQKGRSLVCSLSLTVLLGFSCQTSDLIGSGCVVPAPLSCSAGMLSLSIIPQIRILSTGCTGVFKKKIITLIKKLYLMWISYVMPDNIET